MKINEKSFFLLPNKAKVKAEHVLSASHYTNNQIEGTTAIQTHKFIESPIKRLIQLKKRKGSCRRSVTANQNKYFG